jgi:hypothetical protein
LLDAVPQGEFLDAEDRIVEGDFLVDHRFNGLAAGDGLQPGTVGHGRQGHALALLVKGHALRSAADLGFGKRAGHENLSKIADCRLQISKSNCPLVFQSAICNHQSAIVSKLADLVALP